MYTIKKNFEKSLIYSLPQFFAFFFLRNGALLIFRQKKNYFLIQLNFIRKNRVQSTEAFSQYLISDNYDNTYIT